MNILDVLRILACLAAVVALIWFLQKRGGRWSRKKRGTLSITVAGRQSLGQKASLVVVDVAETRYTLGVTEHGVTLLNSGEAPPKTFEEALANAGAEPTDRIPLGERPLLSKQTWQDAFAAVTAPYRPRKDTK